jgi:hypothetical protein
MRSSIRTGSGRRAASALLAATTVLSVVLLVSPSAAVVRTDFTFTSFSYGTRMLIGNAVTSGPSATSQIGCTQNAPLVRSDDAAGATRKSLITTGNVSTAASTTASPATASSSSTVHGVRLLGGDVISSVVKATSSTTNGAGGLASRGSVAFTDLKVDGHVVRRAMSPNTKRSLPGLGYVILNQQTKRSNATSSSLMVDAIHVVITQPNSLGIAPRTNIFIGHAMTGLASPVIGLFGGEAYGSSATSNVSARSDPKFKILMPCLGTNGKLLADSGAQAAPSGALSSGVDRNTALGTDTADSASGTMTATVHDVSLGDRLLDATGVTAVAKVVDRSGTLRFSDAGSSFEGLSIPGDPSLGSAVPPNTKLSIPGVGVLYLHRIVRTATSIEVRMIELVITHKNVGGLPSGSDIRIGVATVSLR